MKVLIISGRYPSKKNPTPHIFTHNQAKALRKQGIDVLVLEIDMRSIRRKRRLGFYKDEFDGINVYRMAIPCGSVPVLLPFLSKIGIKYAFKKLLKSFGTPDIIHAHFGEVGSWVAPLKNKCGIPFVLTEHNSGMMRKYRTKKVEKYSKIAYAAADKIIAVGRVLKDSMGDLSDKDIIVIPNVIPDNFMYKNVAKTKFFTFISVGGFINRKRFDITIKAFSAVNKKYPETKLKIAGTGELKDELIKLVGEHNITEDVEFLGVVPNNELPDIYNECHCFVLPSMFETFGVVYAEALACGLPVIATRCGGPEDFIDENNGFLIPVDDIDATIEAMEYMYHSSKNYDSEKISKDILEKVSEESVGSSLVEIYKEVRGS